MKKINVLIGALILNLNIFEIQAQTVFDGKVYKRKERPTYITFGGGYSFSRFRDFATSPLFYKGSSFATELGFLKQDGFRERSLGLTLSFGLLNNNYNEINNEYHNATAINGNFHFTDLYKLNRFSNDKWNVKVGGSLFVSGIARLNASLFNNSLGLDGIGNLMLVGKVTKDISRKEDKKILRFIKLKAKKRELSFQQNIGILNLNYRKGSYVVPYLGKIDEKVSYFSNYALCLNGWRLYSRLNYTTYLRNGNGFQVSYAWDVYHLPGKFNVFEGASHSIVFSLMFRNK